MRHSAPAVRSSRGQLWDAATRQGVFVASSVGRDDVAHPAQYTFSAFSSEKDYKETKAFFAVSFLLNRSSVLPIEVCSQDKDTSKYIMSLNQVLDGIQSRAAWVEVRLLSVPLAITITADLCLRSVPRMTFGTGSRSKSRSSRDYSYMLFLGAQTNENCTCILAQFKPPSDL